MSPTASETVTDLAFTAALRQLGVDATDLGIVGDDHKEFEEIIREALAAGPYDAFITTGALSVWKFDFVEEGLFNLNARVEFHKVAIRPGHPVLFALVPSDQHTLKNGLSSQPGSEQHIPFFCLPGNPIATLACFRFLVMPYLRLIHGQISEESIRAQLNISEAASPIGSKVLRKPDHLRVFWHGTLDHANKQVSIHNDQGSNKVRSYSISKLLGRCTPRSRSDFIWKLDRLLQTTAKLTW